MSFLNRNNLFGPPGGQSPSPNRGPRPQGGPPPPPRQMGHRQTPSAGRGGAQGRIITLQPTKAPDNSYTFRNLVAVSSQDFPPSYDGTDVFLLINGMFVVSARPLDPFPRGNIGLSEPQRSWMGVALTDMLQAETFDPFSHGPQAYIGSMDIEIGFASTRKVTEAPYDQDDLAREITKVWFPAAVLSHTTQSLTNVTLYSCFKTRCSPQARDF